MYGLITLAYNYLYDLYLKAKSTEDIVSDVVLSAHREIYAHGWEIKEHTLEDGAEFYVWRTKPFTPGEILWIAKNISQFGGRFPGNNPNYGIACTSMGTIRFVKYIRHKIPFGVFINPVIIKKTLVDDIALLEKLVSSMPVDNEVTQPLFSCRASLTGKVLSPKSIGNWQ